MTKSDQSAAEDLDPDPSDVALLANPRYRGLSYTRLLARLREDVANLTPAEAVLLADWMAEVAPTDRRASSVRRP